jgi:phosphodiesterase/alkaline phosphatase D-like protein
LPRFLRPIGSIAASGFDRNHPRFTHHEPNALGERQAVAVRVDRARLPHGVVERLRALGREAGQRSAAVGLDRPEREERAQPVPVRPGLTSKADACVRLRAVAKKPKRKAKKSTVKLVTGPIVRYVDQTSASIWVELDDGAALFATARARKGTKAIVSEYAHTTPIFAVADEGRYGRYYAIIRFEKLKPATLYSYSITAAYDPNEDLDTVKRIERAKGKKVTFDLSAVAYGGNNAPAFRTLPKGDKEGLRVAFGSCRNLDGGYNDHDGRDALADYSNYLDEDYDNRLTSWPHLLLLMGDQIYSDDVAQAAVDKILSYRSERIDAGKRVPAGLKNSYSPNFSKLDEHLRAGLISSKYTGTGKFHCLSFQEWALLYQTSWNRPEIRRLFANLPTFMLPDDHDLTNGFDITGGWHDQMNNDPDWRAALRDSMMAYWLYQGWGNVSKKAAAAHAILKIIENAHVGDVLGKPGELGKSVEAQLDRDLHAPVYYTIPTSPPIIALDARADRAFVAPVTDTLKNQTKVVAYRHPDDMILGATQLDWFEKQLAKSPTPIIATSMPFLQTLIGDRMMVNLTRLLPNEWPERLETQDHVDYIEWLARTEDAETWYAWARSVERFLELIKTRDAVIILTGDVHYSCLFDTLRDGFDTKSFGISAATRVIQAVSSPIRYPLFPKRKDGVQQFGGASPQTKNSATGKWEPDALQDGNKEHDLRDTFKLPRPVFPDDPNSRFDTYHGGRYTTENLIATLELKRRKVVVQWWTQDGADFVPFGTYAPTTAL